MGCDELQKKVGGLELESSQLKGKIVALERQLADVTGAPALTEIVEDPRIQELQEELETKTIEWQELQKKIYQLEQEKKAQACELEQVHQQMARMEEALATNVPVPEVLTDDTELKNQLEKYLKIEKELRA